MGVAFLTEIDKVINILNNIIEELRFFLPKRQIKGLYATVVEGNMSDTSLEVQQVYGYIREGMEYFLRYG